MLAPDLFHFQITFVTAASTVLTFSDAVSDLKH